MQNKLKLMLGFSAVFLLAYLPAAYAVSSINLSTFGSDVSGDQWTWTDATSTLSGSDIPGAALAPNDFGVPPVNLTILDNYGGDPANLRLELIGFVTTSPGGAFTITLEDDDGNLSATPFLWSTFGSSSSAVINPVTIVSPFNWNSVIGWTLDSGGTGNAVNATFTSLDVTAIPEPSTYALLALGGMALVGYALRRRRRA